MVRASVADGLGHALGVSCFLRCTLQPALEDLFGAEHERPVSVLGYAYHVLARPLLDLPLRVPQEHGRKDALHGHAPFAICVHVHARISVTNTMGKPRRPSGVRGRRDGGVGCSDGGMQVGCVHCRRHCMKRRERCVTWGLLTSRAVWASSSLGLRRCGLGRGTLGHGRGRCHGAREGVRNALFAPSPRLRCHIAVPVAWQRAPPEGLRARDRPGATQLVRIGRCATVARHNL